MVWFFAIAGKQFELCGVVFYRLFNKKFPGAVWFFTGRENGFSGRRCGFLSPLSSSDVCGQLLLYCKNLSGFAAWCAYPVTVLRKRRISLPAKYRNFFAVRTTLVGGGRSFCIKIMVFRRKLLKNQQFSALMCKIFSINGTNFCPA